MVLMIGAGACAEVPPAQPRAPEPIFRSLPVEALPPPPRELRSALVDMAGQENGFLRGTLDVSGTLVVPGDVPVLDIALASDAWTESTCKRLLAEGCVCTVETADTSHTDLATCPGDLSGRMRVTFTAAEEDAAQGLPRTAVARVAIDGLALGVQPYGFVEGIVATTDGLTFTTLRPFGTPDAPLLPERTQAPVAPRVPASAPRSSAFTRGYHTLFWLLKAAGCMARPRC